MPAVPNNTPHAKIPILLISAYEWQDVEREAKEAGVNGFLSKPLFKSTLYDKINEILGTKAKAAEPDADYSDLEGVNVLIAEDYDINWEIISALLSMYGITAERKTSSFRLLSPPSRSSDSRSPLKVSRTRRSHP